MTTNINQLIYEYQAREILPRIVKLGLPVALQSAPALSCLRTS